MRKNILSILLTVVFTSIGLLAAFYFYVQKPKLELPKKLSEAEQIIANNHFDLLQNRLSIVGLAILNSDAKNLSPQKEQLLSAAIKSNEEGLENLQNPPFIRYLEKNSQTSTQNLFEENKRILEEQKTLLKQLTAINNIAGNLYAYKPLNDIGYLDLTDKEERSQAINRAYNAMEGIGNVEKNLLDLENFKNEEQLQIEILSTQDLIKKQIGEMETSDFTAASITFSEVFNKFALMRKLSLDSEKALITSKESVQLITDQTNLLLKYKFMLGKINELQKTLPEVDLFSLY